MYNVYIYIYIYTSTLNCVWGYSDDGRYRIVAIKLLSLCTTSGGISMKREYWPHRWNGYTL